MKQTQRNIYEFETLDSSNCEAKRLAETEHAPAWVLAHRQTKGRGRRGKTWYGSTNNFTASVLIYPSTSQRKFSLYSFVAGLALYDSVIKLGVDPLKLRLKWPNDLLLNGKKLAGILLESVITKRNKKPALIIGFGLNLISCPPVSALDSYPAECLRNNLSTIPDATEFLKILIPIFDSWDDTYLKQGFDEIRKNFLQRTIPIGSNIQVKTISGSTLGKFFGLNDEGSLILDCSKGLLFVTAGDVALIGK